MWKDEMEVSLIDQTVLLTERMELHQFLSSNDSGESLHTVLLYATQNSMDPAMDPLFFLLTGLLPNFQAYSGRRRAFLPRWRNIEHLECSH